MAWETKWAPPVAPEWVKPQLDKISEEAKEASKWVKASSEMLKQPNDQAPVIVGIDYDIKSTPGVDTAWLENGYQIKSIKLGNKTIQVIVVGDLGLDFCEPEEKDGGWNIYHLPTLACFSSAVPPRYMASTPSVAPSIKLFEYDKPELLNWMTRVQENYPTSWQVLRLLTPDTYQDNGATAKEIIQKWCLSVKVE